MPLPCEEWKKKVKEELSNGRQKEGSRALFTSIVIFVFVPNLELVNCRSGLYILEIGIRMKMKFLQKTNLFS